MKTLLIILLPLFLGSPSWSYPYDPIMPWPVSAEPQIMTSAGIEGRWVAQGEGAAWILEVYRPENGRSFKWRMWALSSPELTFSGNLHRRNPFLVGRVLEPAWSPKTVVLFFAQGVLNFQMGHKTQLTPDLALSFTKQLDHALAP